MGKSNKALSEGINKLQYGNRSKEDDNRIHTLEAKVAFRKLKAAFLKARLKRFEQSSYLVNFSLTGRP